MKKRIVYVCIFSVFSLLLCSCSAIQDLKDNLPFLPSGEQQAIVSGEQQATSPIAFNTYSLNLTVGETTTLTVVGGNQTNLTWRSSNESVVLVNSEGVITAVGTGVANISCTTVNGSEAICTVTVSASSVATKPTTTPAKSSDVFPHSSEAYLTETEISQRLAVFTGETPSGSYAQDAINEIYARHGYPFQTPSIRKFYENKGWYAVNNNFSANNFNAFEKANLALLNKFK